MNQTEIVNLALARLSFDPIVSMDERSDRARMVRPVWRSVVETFLTVHEWSFARRLGYPARLAETVGDVGPYRAAFALPQDCIKVRNVYRASQPWYVWRPRADANDVRYQVMRFGADNVRTLLASAEEVAVEYTSNRVPVDEFSPDAQDALASKLAVEICLNLKNASRRAEELLQRFEFSLGMAKKNDVKTQEIRRLQGTDYSDSRE